MELALRDEHDFPGSCVSFRNESIVGTRKSSVEILVESVEVGSAGKRQIGMQAAGLGYQDRGKYTVGGNLAVWKQQPWPL